MDSFYILMVVAVTLAVGLMVGWQWGFACGKNEASKCK